MDFFNRLQSNTLALNTIRWSVAFFVLASLILLICLRSYRKKIFRREKLDPVTSQSFLPINPEYQANPPKPASIESQQISSTHLDQRPELKLIHIDEKTAAIAMAIVSHESGIPAQTLIFKSIRLLKNPSRS